MSGATWRLFVGCFFQDEQLVRGYQELVAACSPWCRAKWVAPESLHLTFAFLGEVPINEVPALYTALAPLLHERACPIHFQGVGVFPHWRAPRVLYIHAKSTDKCLHHTYEQIVETLAGVGLPIDHSRRFVPHITVARLKHIVSLARFKHALTPFHTRSFGEAWGFRPALIRSVLRAEGPLYSEVSPASLSRL